MFNNAVKTQLLNSSLEFLLLSLLMLLAPIALYLDIVVLNQPIEEISITEVTQEILVFASIVCFLRLAQRQPEQSGFALLAAGFFACVFIREMDAVLDDISHGFWFYPAILTALSTIGYVAFAHARTVWQPLAQFLASRTSVYMFVGLLVILVFSRVFGSGHLLWSHLMAERYNYEFKAALQEGLELLGYSFIFYAAFRYSRSLT